MRTNKGLYPLSEIVKLAQAKGINFGNSNPENRIRYYIKFGLLPHAKRKSFNGAPPCAAFPLEVVNLIVNIEKKRLKGKSVTEQKLLLQNQPKVKRKQVRNVQSTIEVIQEPRSNLVPGIAFRLTVLVAALLLTSLFANQVLTNQNVLGVSTNNENGFVRVAKAIVSPLSYLNLGILKVIKTSDSLDPLGLTNISDYIQKDGDKLTFTNKIDADSINTKSINGHQFNNKGNSFVTLNSDGNLEIPGEIKTTIDWNLIKNKPNLANQVNFIAGSNIKISQDSLTGAFTISSTASISLGGSGTITSVVVGTGLSGGGSSGSVPLSIDTAIVASLTGTQTFLNKTLDGSNSVAAAAIKTGSLGAAGLTLAFNSFGSLTGILGDANISNSLTLDATSNIDATALTSGTVSDSRLSTNVTVQGNIFNGASQLVQLDSSIQLPAVSGALLTNLNGSNILSGTVADARLTVNVTTQGNSFNGTNQLVKTNAAGQLPVISGINLTNLTATNINSGTLGNAGVTLAAGSFGSITGTNGSSQLVQLDGFGNLALTGNITGSNNGTVGYWTRNNASSYLYQTTLTDTVGLGTITPSAKLDIVTSQATGTVLSVYDPSLTSGTGLLVSGPTSLTTGSLLSLTGQFSHATGINETGNLAKISFTETTQTASSFTSTSNGLDIATTINVTGTATGTRIANALNIESPNVISCSAGTCTKNAVNIGSGWDNFLSTPNVSISSLGAISGVDTLTFAINTDTIGYVSPLLSNLPTKINIPNFTVPAYGQVLALGLPSTSDAKARGIVVADARSVAHQPSIGILSPNENDIGGFSWEGANADFFIKTLTGGIRFLPGGGSAPAGYSALGISTQGILSQNVLAGAGTLTTSSFFQSTTLSGSLTGQQINLTSNVTALANNVTGVLVNLPGSTNIGSAYQKGVVVNAGSITENTALAAGVFTGIDVTLPNITLTTGTSLTASGVNITTGTITTGGTQNAYLATLTPTSAGTVNGFNIGYATGAFDAATIVNGLNIGAISTNGLGSKTAIKISTGWDTGINIISSANLKAALGMTIVNLTTPCSSSNAYGGTLSVCGYNINTGTNNAGVSGQVYTGYGTEGIALTSGVGLYGSSATGTALQANLTAGASGTIVNFMNVGTSVFSIAKSGQVNMNVAFAGPTCASLNNGDFGFDSTNNRIFWKGTGGTCSYWNRTGTFDIAEHTPATESTQPGDVLVIDTISPTFAVKKSSSPYQQTVVGIESTDPSLISNPDLLGASKFVSKMTLAGRVPTKVSTENGPIQPGDYLTTSSTTGVAMKATTTGPVLGKALEAYNGSAVGKILVFVNISYYLNPNDFKAYTISSNSNLNVTLTNTAKYVWQNSSGQIVASINYLGEAVFSKVTTAIANVNKLIFGEIAVKKGSQSAGVAEIPAGQNEISVSSSKVRVDSLINLTANSEPDGVLYIKAKTAGAGFVVGIKRFPVNATNQKVDFNWLIVNQE